MRRLYGAISADPLLRGMLISGLLHLAVFGTALGIIAWDESHAAFRMDVDQSSVPLLTLAPRPTPLPEVWVIAKKGKAPPPVIQPTPTPQPASPVASRLPSWVGGLIGADDYPVEMRKEKKEGRVIVELVITVEGKVDQVTILQGADPAFNAVVLEKLKDARFQPALDKAGQPMDCRVRLPISFKLN